ncbi:hypothetical protein [Pseudooctadecabacter jejudonensis]|uniref:Transferrin-binding protein B C-lobe/N-lobe beta barrel domain-containing protein n=1 Tax=Pseudooctadecabacter jejudonensis TaxID=1391910 RepID=A0A1Y5RNK1_9RHOB|nr:hypothetical protein [Pseudooctadecabacter jejudonensis]SLN21721.1 hypothetical protein PSJ8397_00843 [Pseudooctadecabacter jejudonensis]
MSRTFAIVAATFALAACDGANPFQAELPDGTTEELAEGDPNTDVNNLFAFDRQASLTLNSVEYDEENDELVLNNLPFDGPDGRYDFFETLPNGTRVYASRQTPTTGQIQHFAVFIRTDYFEATSASGRDWIDFGNAGANINRSDFNLPGTTGEYIYRGTYAATRTFSERSGIEIVYGDVEILLDELDFDPSGDLQGDIVGTVFNRERAGDAGARGLGDLPNIVLAEVSFDTETGTWSDGTASTFLPDGNVRSQGVHEGLIGGPNGEEIGGYSIITGTADIQTVQYQVVRYQIVTETPVIDFTTGLPAVDPITGDPLVTQVITQGVSSGLDTVEIEVLQNQINAGLNVVDFLPATGVPAGVDIISDEVLEFDLATEYDAREIGVFVGDIVPEPVLP